MQRVSQSTFDVSGMQLPPPADSGGPERQLQELRQVAREQQEKIDKLKAEVKALRARLPASSEELKYEDLTFEGNIYQPLVVSELARWMHHNFLPVRLLTDVERRGRVPPPKLPRLGEPLAANVKRSVKDPKFLEAKRLYKGTPGRTDKNVHEALRLFTELAAQNSIPAKLYIVKIQILLYSMTDWNTCVEALRSLCELAIRGYPEALYYLGWKLLRHGSGILAHHGAGFMANNDWQSLCLNSAVAFGYWRAALVQLNRHRGDQNYRTLLQRTALGTGGEEPNPAAKFAYHFSMETEIEQRYEMCGAFDAYCSLFDVRKMLPVYPSAIWQLEGFSAGQQLTLLQQAADLGNTEAYIRLAVAYFPNLAYFMNKRFSTKDASMRVFNPLPLPKADPHKAVSLLFLALENNSTEAATALWALSRHPPAEIVGHEQVNVASKGKFLEIAARFGCVSALRKQRGKQIAAKFLLDVLKPETLRTLRVFPPAYLPGDVLSIIFCGRKYTIKEVLPFRLVSKAWLAWVATAPWNLRLRCGAAQLPFVRRFIGMRYLEADVMSKRIQPLCKDLRSLRIYGRTPLTFKEVCMNTGLTSLSFHCGSVDLSGSNMLLPPPFQVDLAGPYDGDLSALLRLTSLAVLATLPPRGSDGTLRVVLQQVGLLTNLQTFVVVNPSAKSDLSRLATLTQLKRLALQNTGPPVSPHTQYPVEPRDIPAAVLIEALKPLAGLTCLDINKQYSVSGPEMAALLPHFPHLTSLACSSVPVAPVIDALLQHTPNLVALSFCCDPAGLPTSRLSDLISLNALRISTSEECGIANLKELTYLELANDALFRVHTAKLLNQLPYALHVLILLSSNSNLRHFGAIYDHNRNNQQFHTANSVDPAIVCRQLPQRITSLRLSVAASSKGTFMSSQYIDSMSLPALFNQLTGLTRLEMRSPSALAVQELMVLTSLKCLRYLSLDGGVSDGLVEALGVCNPLLEPNNVWVFCSAKLIPARRGYQVDGSSSWHTGLNDVFVTSSLEELGVN